MRPKDWLEKLRQQRESKQAMIPEVRPPWKGTPLGDAVEYYLGRSNDKPTGSVSFEPFSVLTGENGWVRHRPSGFYFLWRDKGDACLSIDNPSLISGGGWGLRETALSVAEHLSTPIIPVSMPALSRSGVQHPRLVERIGAEAVFQDAKTGTHFLSGWDQQETPPLYFLCALPRAVETIAEAREVLKPESVLRAERAGVVVKRQGDLFGIASHLTNEVIRANGGKIFPTPEVGEVVPLYGTAHTASRVAVLPGGMMLASGVMRHDPKILGQRRNPDHHNLDLGEGWWWVAKNTVPVTGSPVVSPHYVRPPGGNTATFPAVSGSVTFVRPTVTFTGNTWIR